MASHAKESLMSVRRKSWPIVEFMKNKFIANSIACLLGLCCAFLVSAQAATPKQLLVVTVTKGFRHSSIPTAEKVLGELGQKSGAITVDYVRTDEDMAQKMTPGPLRSYDGVRSANASAVPKWPDKPAVLDGTKP